MKNGLLIWNVVLTLLVGYLIIDNFGPGRKKSSSNTSFTSNDSASANASCRIAYFEMDSVAAKFEEVRQLKTELSKKEEANNSELNRLTQQFRDRYKYYQDQAERGTLTEPQSIAASEELKQLEENIKNRKMQLEQDYNDFYMRRQTDIKSKIESFIKEYNKDRRYAYVLSDDPGLFYYRDTTFNITPFVIEGLNKLYPAKKTK